MESIFAVAAFVLGAVIGSFLNVVIHRYPREESIVFPPSHCGSCGAHIKAYDNVPILSWIILRGRCRACRAPFSIRYLLVELANALFYVAVFERTGVSILFLPVAALVSMTITLIYIDAEIQILPDVIDVPGIAVGLTIGALAIAGSPLLIATSITDSLIGAVAGGGVLLAIALAYKALRGIEGMGLGDVKMLAMIGAALGWRPLYAMFLIACVSGAVVGITIAVATRRTNLRFAIPFGVFLGFSFLFMMFFGNDLLEHVPVLSFGR